MQRRDTATADLTKVAKSGTAKTAADYGYGWAHADHDGDPRLNSDPVVRERAWRGEYDSAIVTKSRTSGGDRAVRARMLLNRAHNDPDVREPEPTWAQLREMVTKSQATTGARRADLDVWESIARTDPDPGVREAMWTAIRKAAGVA